MNAIRNAAWRLPRSLLFRLDAEDAHRLTVHAIRASRALGRWPARIAGGAPAARPERTFKAMGLEFHSRVGLAAGFDKDCEILSALPDLGFGHAEIGTVTPKPQPGNPRPRLFRDPARRALFNRMGFNSSGALEVAKRLEDERMRLSRGFVVGVNVGKNKDTPNEDAHRDYAAAIAPFRGLADYVAVNVSSPNTPGLRSLQSSEALKRLLGEVRAEISAWNPEPPLAVKLAPEIGGDELARLLEDIAAFGARGVILTNTLAGERRGDDGKSLAGGWSGDPLAEIARERLREARLTSRLDVISVGGITTPGEAARRVELGAALVQVYSGWIYGGPGFPGAVARAADSC